MPSSPVSDGDRGPAEQERGRDETLTEEPSGGEQRDLEDELARGEERYRRALADLDNYRKRSAREVERQVAERSDRIVRDWLEAVDSVDRALRMQAPANELAAGLRAVMEQMEAILQRQGVERTGAPGDRFDPALHEAIGMQESDAVPDRGVVEVARSGYRQGDRVLRPAQVIVSRRPEGEPGEEEVED
jgi:molecular chaperone GrpE